MKAQSMNTSSSTSRTRLEVGSVVRIKQKTTKRSARAMVAMMTPQTTTEEDRSVTLLWESKTPEPLTDESRFLVTPTFGPSNTNFEDENEEVVVLESQVQELLSFEGHDHAKNDAVLAVDQWKEYGDNLLRIGDVCAAIPYYEQALQRSSTISIGSTVVISLGGFPKIAEVDCCDDDSLDVTVVDTGDERTVKYTEVLIGLLPRDEATHWQERILLNLARCLLQMTEWDEATHKPRYFKAVVLACSLTITLATYYDNSSDNNTDDTPSFGSYVQTALDLRIQALRGLSKWPNATQDARRLQQAGNPKGQKHLEVIERQKQRQKTRDKRLAKEVCKWVQTASQSGDAVSEQQHEEPDHEAKRKTSRAATAETAHHPTKPHHLMQSIAVRLFIPLLVSYLIHRALFS